MTPEWSVQRVLSDCSREPAMAYLFLRSSYISNVIAEHSNVTYWPTITMAGVELVIVVGPSDDGGSAEKPSPLHGGNRQIS
jgi:hypothetical protein